jgi:hypothetical protein
MTGHSPCRGAERAELVESDERGETGLLLSVQRRRVMGAADMAAERDREEVKLYLLL